MQIASFTTNSIVRVACCSILVSPQLIGWSSVQACLAMADLSMKPLMHASLCSFRRVSSLADVHLSAGARHFVDDVCLLLHMEGVFDFNEERTEGGSGLEHRSDVEVLTHSLDLLTNASYVGEVDSGWPFLLPFPVLLPRRPGYTGRTDEGARITIPNESFHEVVLLFLQILPLLCNAPSTVVETPYRTLLYMCWMVRPKVQLHTCPCVSVYNNVKFTVFFPCYPCIKEGERPTLLHLHGEFYGWAYAV